MRIFEAFGGGFYADTQKAYRLMSAYTFCKMNSISIGICVESDQ